MSIQPEGSLGTTENIAMGIPPNEGLGTVYEDANPASSTSNSMNITNTTARMDGVGNLLYHLHSTHFKSLLFAKEETSLQFYEHVVIATVISRFWCFPKKCQVNVIPRFKIIGTTFSLGPRRVPMLFWLFLAAAVALIVTGVILGGCKSCEEETNRTLQYDSYDYWDTGYYSSSYSDCTSNGGTCASLVIGIILAAIPVPLLLLIPCIWKWHYVYLDVKVPSKKFFSSGFETWAFRFKKMGFDHSTDDKAIFDEFYLVDYVYGSFSKGGDDVMSEAHLLSHFNHVSLATPIVPLHANTSIRDIVLPAVGVNRRKKHIPSGQKGMVAIPVPGSIRPSHFAPKTVVL